MTDSDEAFYAEAAREMVESGDWLTPYYDYEPRFQKPILYYWLTAATFVVTGPGEAPARLWSALSGVALVFVTAGLARRWYDDDTALLAGAVVATSFGYVALGRMSLPDLPLALFVTATIGAALVAIGDRVPRPRGWLVGAAVAAALGFLMKGPLAVVLPVIVVAPIVAIERRASRLAVRMAVPSRATAIRVRPSGAQARSKSVAEVSYPAGGSRFSPSQRGAATTRRRPVRRMPTEMGSSRTFERYARPAAPARPARTTPTTTPRSQRRSGFAGGGAGGAPEAMGCGERSAVEPPGGSVRGAATGGVRMGNACLDGQVD